MARNDSYEELINNSLDQIELWVESNCTDKEIAEKLGIAYSTFRKYKGSSVALKGRIATAKDKKNDEVEKALFKNCVGYDYEEETPVKIKEEYTDENGNVLTRERVIVKSLKKHKPADLAAQKYWLNNRKSAKWMEDPNKVANDKKLTKLKEKEVNSKVIE